MSKGLLADLEGPVRLSQAILGAWKARKWLPFACFEPSTFSLRGAADGSPGRLLAPPGPLPGPKLDLKVAEMHNKQIIFQLKYGGANLNHGKNRKHFEPLWIC